MRKEIIVGLLALTLLASIGTVMANVQPVPKATGEITMSAPSQQAIFCAFDEDSAGLPDKGTVEYWNYNYQGGVLHYTADVLCATADGDEFRFMFQIPAGWPGLSGLYVIVSVYDGGTPGVDGDTWGHTATSNLATAISICENGGSFTNYPITSGNLVVHG